VTVANAPSVVPATALLAADLHPLVEEATEAVVTTLLARTIAVIATTSVATALAAALPKIVNVTGAETAT
jgi:hypothetical protein